jgi:leucyl/phenylalanyl-tRNA--protein transferase
MLTWVDPGRPLPSPSKARQDPNGLLAAGRDLSPERLLEAYSRGIFPWYSAGQPVLWWSPDPRMLLRTDDFKLSHSLRKTLRRFLRSPGCELRFDHDTARVMAHCAQTPRDGQDGTWIVPEMQVAYGAWALSGDVHSVETWVDGQLCGGLYCVGIGRMVFGESMFARRTDASKIALAALVAFCRAHGVGLIDCQQNTRHLASMGAREWTRTDFEHHLQQATDAPDVADWTYDPRHWACLGLDVDAAGVPE